MLYKLQFSYLLVIKTICYLTAKPLKENNHAKVIPRRAAAAGWLSTSALAQAPETVNIGYQKANIFALLKYRGTLDESFKNRASPCAGWNSRRPADAGRAERRQY
jgi:hypothetical protein